MPQPLSLKSLESLFSCEGVQPRSCWPGIGCAAPDVISLVTSSLMIFADSDWFTLKVYVGSFTLVPPQPPPAGTPAPPCLASPLDALLPLCLGGAAGRVSTASVSLGREVQGHGLSGCFGLAQRLPWAC